MGIVSMAFFLVPFSLGQGFNETFGSINVDFNFIV